ncbi:MAG TPA: zinc/manganese transporter permease [Gallionella sp.]|jgi:zinc/manganese transport system permease protein|nr:metal ABC transporter permease [Gallionella sp.]OGS67224.1 MAG: zinc/manganese transporter permease [Gallionellales bacterium GWA2_54_124]OGT18488.1 MAG: zinc/manganese transporter permease [Gallionellales bacterium RIFOXYD12_FULL_53_10]HCI52021.1 zinc/manganese transporter permease [Gallionella sp.]
MNSIELDILIPAFIAGLLVLATHIPLGMKVMTRGVIFADLAVAQIAGLGIVLASMLNLTEHPLMVQVIAAASALLGAALLAWIEQNLPDVKEACIGLTFVLAASGGILLMSHDVHAGEHLKDLLVGQILWVNPAQLIATALLSAVLLAVWRWQQPGHLGFYALFALAVTASVQLVGVYLVFASLIVPALATYRIEQHRILYAALIGVTGYAAGLLLSALFDLPCGAAIVWAMAITGGVIAVRFNTRNTA